jgi:hypothetical protein
LNTLGVIPRVIFGLNVTGTDPIDFTCDNRLGNTARDKIYSLRDNITWTRNRHTLKAGGYLEYMANNEARGGNWMGDATSRATRTTRSTRGSPIPTRCSACSLTPETDSYRQTNNRAWMSEFYAQDTFTASPSHSTTARDSSGNALREGGRPGRQLRSGALRSRESAAPLFPAIINGTRVAQDRDRTNAERDLHRRDTRARAIRITAW